jgi:hypothetical protein
MWKNALRAAPLVAALVMMGPGALQRPQAAQVSPYFGANTATPLFDLVQDERRELRGDRGIRSGGDERRSARPDGDNRNMKRDGGGDGDVRRGDGDRDRGRSVRRDGAGDGDVRRGDRDHNKGRSVRRDGDDRDQGSNFQRDRRTDRGDRDDRRRHRGKRHVWGPGIEFWFFDGYYHGDCDWLRRKAISTDSDYWWSRYRLCREWS